MFHPPISSQVTDNRGYRRMFSPKKLTLGLFFPIENFSGDEPTMQDQERLARRAEELGFAALWVRDVPLRDPNFGDVGQVFDPWVYLGWIAAHTREIALATGSIVLTLRHPLHTAKAAASVDQLSGGRLVLGVGSGDRPVEFPAFGVPFDERGDRFRHNLQILREAWSKEFPVLSSPYYGHMQDADLVPKPSAQIPVLVTGHSQQSLDWIAKEADGWITYPRALSIQSQIARRWQEALAQAAPGQFKPMVQSFYVDLTDDPDIPPEPIHLGFRGGRKAVLAYLKGLEQIGVNHVILNFKYGRRPAEEVLEEIGEEVLPLLK
ncbi:LLM class oxidoreductase [Alicyclobacillus macrosporangiidus]|uniref:Luciferase-type oxidoreductase, BA3436 family n=1 Tax=Alicyclobacillus macrosporangiidus TaxID=392015 RepID=A0A1I7L710_9BACL|nr:LLM class oxidoreductase [Alicyclobacillus macrosporangiidus]SFV05415.1 luciferase-type oxidoreductase, BA3436 family [Alicyclobacillus macrosporangiidus]